MQPYRTQAPVDHVTDASLEQQLQRPRPSHLQLNRFIPSSAATAVASSAGCGVPDVRARTSENGFNVSEERNGCGVGDLHDELTTPLLSSETQSPSASTSDSFYERQRVYQPAAAVDFARNSDNVVARPTARHLHPVSNRTKSCSDKGNEPETGHGAVSSVSRSSGISKSANNLNVPYGASTIEGNMASRASPITAVVTARPSSASSKRPTKFTVINYGAADVLQSKSKEDGDDDDDDDDVALPSTPDSRFMAFSKGRSNSGQPSPVADDVQNFHAVRFRSLAEDHPLSGTSPAAGVRRLPTTRQVPVDSAVHPLRQVSSYHHHQRAVVVPTVCPAHHLRQPALFAPSSLSSVDEGRDRTNSGSGGDATSSRHSSRPSSLHYIQRAAAATTHNDVILNISSTNSDGEADHSRASLACCCSSVALPDFISANTHDDLGSLADKNNSFRAAAQGSLTERDRLRSLRWSGDSGQPLSFKAHNGNIRPSPFTDSPPQEKSAAIAVEDLPTSSGGGRDSSRNDVVDMWRLRDVAKRGRLFAKRCKRRLVYQSGECNVSYVNVERRGARFLLDIFTTLLEMKWRYNIVVYLVTFVLSWVIFALIWWMLHVIHGTSAEGEPCVVGVEDFKSALLFSIETQHTIGYGSRSLTSRCPDAIFVLMSQCLFGAVTQCIVTGIIFAKMARPKGRAETVVFSRKAVIHRDRRDGTLCLSFRVGDLRDSQLIGVSINALLVRKHRVRDQQYRPLMLPPYLPPTTTDGKPLPPSTSLNTTTTTNKTANQSATVADRHVKLLQQRLHISTESGDDFYFLAWPVVIVHRIDETSPLWELSSEQLLVADFEILIVLEANCEATGATTQVRTSYLPSDILWGHELAPLFTYQKDNGRFKVDFSQFNNTIEVDTPEMSAKDMASAMYNSNNNNSNSLDDISENTRFPIVPKYYNTPAAVV